MSNKNDLQEKLQAGYHSMLEHIEELVDKEKKPLKEAFAEAEEKLSEWRELSREEIDKISEELKTNLGDLGRASNELRESLRETLKFDAAYLANNLWGKLANVADKTITELAEFSESLQLQTVVDETTYSEQQQGWINDAKRCKTDYQTSLTQIDEAKQELQNQLKIINDFHDAVLLNEADQSRYHLLSQMCQETTQHVNNFHKRIVVKDQNWT